MKIVPGADKRAPLRSLGAAGDEPSQSGTTRIIGVVATVNRSIEINPMVVPGRVQSASTAIDIDMATWIERGPGMRVVSHDADRQLVRDPVVDAQADSTRREIVTQG